MFKKVTSTLIVLLLFSGHASASKVTTAQGKIIFTEGHQSPSCRTVGHKENDTGVVRIFRIKQVDGDDGIAEIASTALIHGRDVTVTYDSNLTTGCGSENAISHIRMY